MNSRSGAQYSRPISTQGKLSILRVWISVATSKTSSSVPKPPGQRDERVGVLHEHQLAHEEVLELDEAVQVRVRLLLVRQLDVAADRERADVAGAAVRRLHDAGASARHHREAHAADPATHLARERVVGIAFVEARGAEDRDAGPHEVERAKPAQQLGEDAQRAPQLGEAAGRPGEEAALAVVRLAWIPLFAQHRAWR